MQEPQNLAACRSRPGVHLSCTAAFAAPNELFAEPFREFTRAVGACPIDHNDFRSWCSLAKMLEKGAYQLRLIENRNNDRDLHSEPTYDIDSSSLRSRAKCK